MGFKRNSERAERVERDRRLRNLPEADLYLAAEQALMTAGMNLSKVIAGSEDAGFYLEELALSVSLVQKVLVEVSFRNG